MKNYMGQQITRFFGVLLAAGSWLGSMAQTTYSWNPAGPIYTAGRARNMVVDKNDPTGNTLYVGSTSSGVFKSTNGGTTWAPVDDQGSVRNISYMAQSSDGTIWVATGEGFLRFGQRAKAQKGTGLYKLVGNQLQNVKDTLPVGSVITRIACHPNDPNKIALATNLGIVVSTNGGSSFSVLSLPGFTVSPAYVTGMDVKFDNAGILYASAGSEWGWSASIYSNVESKVYKSTDASLSALINITPSNSAVGDTRYGRIELAVAPSNNNVVYASCAAKSTANPTTGVLGAPASATLKALYVSYDAGSSWALVTQGSSQLDPLSNGGTIASGDYAHIIMVSPTDPNTLFYGGYAFYVYQRTSGTNQNPIGAFTRLSFSNIPNFPIYIHENIHDIKIVNKSGKNVFYFITDAGIYRSVDLQNLNQTTPPSYQPFYKGLVTGQFNSVSMMRYPIGANTSTSSASGQSVTPYSGFIGGTGGNGLNYYSGTFEQVTQEVSYLGGEIYNAELSKILDGAAIMSTGNGAIYRSTNVRTSAPTPVNINRYSGALSKTAPTSEQFLNTGISTGTPFRLWENYGQLANSPDYAIFYNDSDYFNATMIGLATLTTQSTFSISFGRPNAYAMIDSIVIRTATVTIANNDAPNVGTPFTGSDLKDIFIKFNNNYVLTGTTTTLSPVSVVGPYNTSSPPTLLVNTATNQNIITVSFNGAPFANKTATFPKVSDPAAYYRVFATVFYRYKAGDVVSVTDNNISTRAETYTGTLTSPLRWTRTFNNVNPNPTGPKTGTSQATQVNTATNPVFRIPTKRSARLALVLNNGNITLNNLNPYAIVVCKSPLNLNDPLNFVRVSQSGCYSDNSSGLPTTNTINIPGKPILLEWSHGGTEIYYATDDNKLYRVSHITDIMDLSPSSYKGKLYTDVFSYANPLNANTLNPNCPYRTTLIGTFNKPISSISVSKDDKNLVVTLTGSGSGGSVWYNSNDASKSDVSNIGWSQKGDFSTGSYTTTNTYCSMMEKDDNKKVFVGTDKGVAYTNDITSASPVWVDINSTSAAGAQLPNVQVFDIKQQVLDPWDCYNSGQIYIATYGRGIWTSSNFLRGYYTGVESAAQSDKESVLRLFPNPTNNQVNIEFNGIGGEQASVEVMDISGRLVLSENLGTLEYGETSHTLNLENFNSGVYLVNIKSTAGTKRVAKLVVAK